MVELIHVTSQTFMLKSKLKLKQRLKLKQITIFDKNYDLETLPEEIKNLINNLQAVEEEGRRLQTQAGIAGIAKEAMLRDLSEKIKVIKEIETPEEITE